LKADYAKIGPQFGEAAPKIIAQLSLASSESILDKIQKQGKYVVVTDAGNFELTQEHIIKKYEVPDQYIASDVRGMMIYLDSERTAELEAEGYARELMRRIQSLRKNVGLQKNQKIDLLLKTSEEMEDQIKNYQEQIKEKVGAEKIAVTCKQPSAVHETTSKEKVKGQGFDIFFSVVK
jgi:isoleucyl-tRNA synthetase